MINPIGMELPEWAAATTLALANYASPAILVGKDWQSWGAAITRDPRLTALNPPDPYQFSDWREWGCRLIEALNNVG
ncbi:MAG: hypothetical protein JST01_28575 [Cyanobacteria bacterium SZAS TMP-1]|nr:hypothetical protein [Cyanobacteria bacterium SZAS TMP-1]